MSTAAAGSFAGRVVLITGANRGIGHATGRRFHDSGAKVVLLNRSASVPAMVLDGAVELICDVADWVAVDRAMTQVAEQFGRLDVVVNNAGTIEPIARIEQSDPALWARVIATNLVGAYNVARAAIPIMLDGGGGTIVNISSGAATSPLEGWSHYCASKAGLRALTACLDLELRGKGIRALGLSPGTVATDMQVTIRQSGINPVSRLAPDSHIPPEWVAQSIAWLTTSAADPFLGTDFSLKTAEGRATVGLPAV